MHVTKLKTMKRLRQGFADVNHNDHDYHRYSDYEYRHNQRSEQYEDRHYEQSEEQFHQSNHRDAQQFADDPYYRAPHYQESYSDDADYQPHRDDYHPDSFSPRRDEPIEPTFDAPYVEDADYFDDQYAEYDDAGDFASDYYEAQNSEQYQHTPAVDTRYAHEYEDPQREPIISARSHSAPGALHAEDFYDTSQQSGYRLGRSLSKIGFGIAAVVFVAAFSAITIIASKPQMTPEEIVQMDGYKGAGSDKAQTMFFNLASLRGCETTEDCEGVVRADGPTADSARSASGNTDYREIPAAAITSSPETTPTAAIESSTWLVRQQWSIVRDQPDMSGAIITSLAANKRVEVIDQMGDWYQIKHQSVAGSRTGYMHRSLLQRPK